MNNRRQFLSSLAAAAALGVHSSTAAAPSRSTIEKLNLGFIGVANRGSVNLAAMQAENIVALCDVDETHLGPVKARFPRAATYHDFRRLLERKALDGVVISTPDHTHAHAALTAIAAGLHVYCEQPLAHSVGETGRLAAAAARAKVVTQMGNQHHNRPAHSDAVRLVKSGRLGPVTEVHCWSSRPLWPQGMERPKATPPVPKSLAWDLWLGPAPARPYHPAYHPMNWRGWRDFGTGALGAAGTHKLDVAADTLSLAGPTAVTARQPASRGESHPKRSRVSYRFPARAGRAGLSLHWYDGGLLPSAKVLGGRTPPANGSVLKGMRASLFVPHKARRVYLMTPDGVEPVTRPADEPPPVDIWREWLSACKGQGKTSCDFTYAARLTEICLLGNVALAAGGELKWDAAARKFTNSQAANALVEPEYRKGWELPAG